MRWCSAGSVGSRISVTTRLPQSAASVGRRSCSLPQRLLLVLGDVQHVQVTRAFQPVLAGLDASARTSRKQRSRLGRWHGTTWLCRLIYWFRRSHCKNVMLLRLHHTAVGFDRVSRAPGDHRAAGAGPRDRSDGIAETGKSISWPRTVSLMRPSCGKRRSALSSLAMILIRQMTAACSRARSPRRTDYKSARGGHVH